MHSIRVDLCVHDYRSHGECCKPENSYARAVNLETGRQNTAERVSQPVDVLHYIGQLYLVSVRCVKNGGICCGRAQHKLDAYRGSGEASASRYVVSSNAAQAVVGRVSTG